MKRILHISIALLLLAVAGQNAWAETKTVTYTLSREKVGEYDFFALTHSGSTPFDQTTTVEHQQETGRTQATFHLPDGFTFTFTWGSGATITSVGSGGSTSYFQCQDKNVKFELAWNTISRYVTAVSVTDDQGDPSALNSSGTASTAFTYSENGHVSYTLKTNARFIKLNITYTDVPGLNIFTQLGEKTYEIKSKDDLRYLAEFVNNGKAYNTANLTFRQTQDITFTHKAANEAGADTENNFTAIGTADKDFCGTYDGQGHTISGIRIYKPDDPNQGLFGKIFNGAVRGVRLADARITGKLYVGGIVGNMFSSTVEDCAVANNVCIHAVQDNSNYHGGIVGVNYGTVQRCLSQATLTVANASDCQYYGAIAGCTESNSPVKDCIAIGGNVPDVSKRGAITGRINNNSTGNVQRNYYRACSVAGTSNATDVGVGFESSNQSPHDVTDNQGAQALYRLTMPSGVTLDRTASATLPGTGNKTYTTGADIDGTPYAFSGATVTLNYSGDVPFGKAVVYSATAGTIDGNVLTMPAADVTVSATLVDNLWGEASGADGSAEKPFRISNTAGLDSLAVRVNRGVSTYSDKHFLQTANLIYDGTENNYTAIGTSSHAFSGHYDGGEKTIRGININKTGTDENADGYLGIFGYVDGGTIEKLALAGSTIVGYRYVGGIAGYLNGTVKNCRVEADVTLSSQSHSDKLRQYWYFGGIAGYFQSGTIQGCVCGAGIQVKSKCSFYETGGIVGHSGGTLSSNVYYGTSMPNDSFCGAILGSGSYSHNNYYTAITGFPKGKGSNSNERSADVIINGNASYPKLLTLGKHVGIDGEEVEYPFSGLTDLGGKALRYDDGNSVRIFTHLMQSITFSYTGGNVPEGKNVAFSWSSSAIVRPISGNTWNTSSDFYNWHKSRNAFAIQAALVSDPVTITSKPAMGGYWATFYSSASYNLPEGTVAYTMDSNGQLHPLVLNNRSTLKGKEILGCVAVVLFSDKESITLTRINENWDTDAFPYENILLGSDDPVPVVNGLVDGKTPYVLGVVDGVFGFHPFTGTEIPANKAYYLQ